ncbi:metal ABC transporter ATP-binding protein [Deferribacter abyssi]|uniref:metal ABC transporter ATP-binding protein n=1 Tax=Deferribacter abyssi TaxID=213806 RepID=UPI003C1B7ED4
MENNLVIEIKNLNVLISNKHILQNINLTLKEKEIMAVVGPNGGGKTTLLKTILGFYKPSSGTIKIMGKQFNRIPKGMIGYLPQKDLINYNFPILVYDVVLMGRKILKRFLEKTTAKDKEICLDSLNKVGMTNYAYKPFNKLSGGQKQRVLIARLLAMKPKILLFDEPATGLDVVGQEDFYELINKLKKEENISILMVTHDIGVISNYVDMIACLNKTIHYHGPPQNEIQIEILEKLFGKNIQFIIHDHHCITCKGVNDD